VRGLKSFDFAAMLDWRSMLTTLYDDLLPMTDELDSGSDMYPFLLYLSPLFPSTPGQLLVNQN
jgi:hypothetical protein